MCYKRSTFKQVVLGFPNCSAEQGAEQEQSLSVTSDRHSSKLFSSFTSDCRLRTESVSYKRWTFKQAVLKFPILLQSDPHSSKLFSSSPSYCRARTESVSYKRQSIDIQASCSVLVFPNCSAEQGAEQEQSLCLTSERHSSQLFLCSPTVLQSKVQSKHRVCVLQASDIQVSCSCVPQLTAKQGAEQEQSLCVTSDRHSS